MHTIEAQRELSAAELYDTGFAHRVKRHVGGVGLFDIELIENDSPGATAFSEKGVHRDAVFGANRARKILHLDDPRAHTAYLLFFFGPDGRGSAPLHFEVNGHRSRVELWDPATCKLFYRWTEFPTAWLKEGENVIDLYCPEARTEEEGWNLYIARADEFEHGGGDPKEAGKTSLKSFDDGRTWSESPFGDDGETRGEYVVRLSLDRHLHAGWVASPVIDLWRTEADELVVPQREVGQLRLRFSATVPEATAVDYYLRCGRSPNPFEPDWEPYRHIGSGGDLEVSFGEVDLGHRYVQLRASLSSANPLRSPVLRAASWTAALRQRPPTHANIRVVRIDNEPIAYSSLGWEWERWDRPEHEQLRQRENLDEVVAGSRTQFDAQVKLLDYTTRRWRHSSPEPAYPGWDALSILDRVEAAGGGGMCIQFNNVLAGLCQAFGWQARLLNVVNHEVCEVWNDEFGKWVFMDADFQNHYNYLPASAEPLSALELHEMFLDYYFPDRAIDWMNDWIGWMEPIEGRPVPAQRGSLTDHEGTQLTGFNCCAFIKVLPRNNFYDKPFPRPANHRSVAGPWNGYVSWYDERTPPKRQYSRHTDRPRDLWPDLNRVFVEATAGLGNDRLFLRFETYTPNFSHFEIDVDDTGWREQGERWTWLLQSGRNSLRVRAVSHLGVRGKPSVIELNHADVPFLG